MKKISTDQEVYEQIEDKSRKVYIRSWKEFKEFIPNFNFEKCHPGEENIIEYFRYLRQVKKAATSTMWTIYSTPTSTVSLRGSME